jgi:hypothetical protein
MPGALVGQITPEGDVGEEWLEEAGDGPVVVGVAQRAQVPGLRVGLMAGLGWHRGQQQADSQ